MEKFRKTVFTRLSRLDRDTIEILGGCYNLSEWFQWVYEDAGNYEMNSLRGTRRSTIKGPVSRSWFSSLVSPLVPPPLVPPPPSAPSPLGLPSTSVPPSAPSPSGLPTTSIPPTTSVPPPPSTLPPPSSHRWWGYAGCCVDREMCETYEADPKYKLHTEMLDMLLASSLDIPNKKDHAPVSLASVELFEQTLRVVDGCTDRVRYRVDVELSVVSLSFYLWPRLIYCSSYPRHLLPVLGSSLVVKKGITSLSLSTARKEPSSSEILRPRIPLPKSKQSNHTSIISSRGPILVIVSIRPISRLGNGPDQFVTRSRMVRIVVSMWRTTLHPG